MQRQRQYAVGSQVVHNGVVLGAGTVEGAMIPLQGQLAGAQRGVERGIAVVPHIQAVQHQAVAAAAVGVVERHIGHFAVEGLSVVGDGQLVLVHRVAHLAARRCQQLHRDAGVEHTAQRVGDQHRVGDGGVGAALQRRGDHKGGVATARHIFAIHIGIRHRRHIVGARQAVGVQCQLPAEDIAVVHPPAVDDLDIPGAVHRTANQVAERVVGVVEMGACRHIRRVGGVIRRVVVRGAVYQAVAARVGKARVGAVRPAVAPSRAGTVVVPCRIAGIRVVLIVHRQP